MYPIAKADFSLHDSPALSESNFARKESFEVQADSLQNYKQFIRMRFKDCYKSSQGKELDQVRCKDLYFAAKNNVWLSQLCEAKKQLLDQINTQASNSQDVKTPSKSAVTTTGSALRTPNAHELSRRSRELTFV